MYLCQPLVARYYLCKIIGLVSQVLDCTSVTGQMAVRLFVYTYMTHI